jgi:hypothetical protein
VRAATRRSFWMSSGTLRHIALLVMAGIMMASNWLNSPKGARLVFQTQSFLSRLGGGEPGTCGAVGWAEYTLVSTRVLLPDGALKPAAGALPL